MENNTELTIRQWIKVSFIGWLCGAVLVIITSGMFDAIGLEGYQFYLGISMGGSVGFFQWRTLSRIAGIRTTWIWASMFGMGTPFFLFDLLRIFAGISIGSYYLPISIVAGGLLTSILQMVVLKQHSQNAVQWIWICFAGWILAATTILSIDYVKLIIHHNWTLFVINLVLIFSGGAVLGAVTGLPLMKMLKK